MYLLYAVRSINVAFIFICAAPGGMATNLKSVFSFYSTGPGFAWLSSEVSSIMCLLIYQFSYGLSILFGKVL